MCYNYFDGNVKKAAQMQIDAIPLINALFSEVNPIPVKEALNICGTILRTKITISTNE